MKFTSCFPLLPALLLFAACDLKDNGPDDDTTPPGYPPCSAEAGLQSVIFKVLAVGQKSRFVYFTGEKYLDGSGEDFQYRPDTLALEIVDVDNFGFRVRECLTPGSQHRPQLAAADSALFYYLRVENEFLRPRRGAGNTAQYYSRLFLDREIPLPLSDVETVGMQLAGWKTEPVAAGEYREGFCKGCSLLGAVFPHLNFVVDNAKMTTGGLGYTWVYATTGGLVRFFSVNPHDGSGSGWDLLPD